jgi:superfamily II DNA/RNA helicase
MTGIEKDRAVEKFRNEVPLFLCTESGGEGRNLQFCNTMVNFDLPWNPMSIEQRIGRIHRIGQTRDVFIFNLITIPEAQAPCRECGKEFCRLCNPTKCPKCQHPTNEE